jgi:hypothetical protein
MNKVNQFLRKYEDLKQSEESLRIEFNEFTSAHVDNKSVVIEMYNETLCFPLHHVAAFRDWLIEITKE